MEQTTTVDLKKDAPLIDEEKLKHPDEYRKFAVWLALPPLMRRPPRDKNGNTPTVREFAERMGIEDDDAIALLECPTQTAFSEKFGISQQTLSAWKADIKQRDILADIRAWANDLNSNVVFSLYNKTIQGGLPEHYKLWFQVIAGWSEKFRVDQRVIKTITFEVVPAPHHVEATPVEPAP